MSITRRDSLALGVAALGGSSAPLFGAQAAVTDVPMADVKPPNLPIEKGAALHVLRPAKFVAADEVVFKANVEKFTAATGVQMKVDWVSWEDLGPQTAVIANTGAGADIVIGFSSSPFIYTSKIVEMTDVATYLGAKYGGWYDLATTYGTKWKTKEWISIPMGGGTGPTVYRTSWVRDAGYDKIPNDHEGFLLLCEKLQKMGHPCGFSLGHAVGDGNGFVSWALWSHNARMIDPDGRVAIESKETIAALKYVARLYKTMIPGTLTWLDVSNNQAYLAGQIGLTFNGISIYYAAKNSSDPAQKAIAADTSHQLAPFGLSKRAPQSATPLNAMVFKHSKYPNAAKEFIRFMMEADQYGPWLSECLGYWCNPLKAYSQMKFWDADPAVKPFAGAMDTPFYDGYAGPVSAASAAVTANYTLVDMFASVATGTVTPEAAVKQAARQIQRYYKGA